MFDVGFLIVTIALVAVGVAVRVAVGKGDFGGLPVLLRED